MNATTLFYALSHSIWISLGQGILIFIIVKVVFLASPNIASVWRYRVLYSALSLMLWGFIISFFQAYSRILPLEALGLHGTASLLKSETSVTNLLSIQNILQRYSPEITAVYFTGLIVHICLLLSGLYQISNIRNKGEMHIDTEWETKLRLLSQKLKISQKVALYFTEHITVPLTVGFLKPIILFPFTMANQLSTEQVEAILLHELAHIKRYDYLLNILQRVMEIILFFNPITWLLAKDIKREREYCCDDLVLNYTTSPGTYARALLIIEENRKDRYSLTMAASGNEKNTLLNRIKRLKVMKTVNSNPKQRLLALLSLVAISLSLAWVIPADSTKVKRTKNKSVAKFSVPPPPLAPVPLVVSDISIDIPPPPPALEAPNPPTKIGRSKDIYPPIDTNKIDTNVRKYLKGSDWKKQQEAINKQVQEELSKQFNSPEWKTQQEKINRQVQEEINKQFNSPEWKKQMDLIKKQTKDLSKKFNSPEWKKQQKMMARNSEELQNKFNSAEWKMQMEEINKQFNSTEWKNQMEEIKKNAEEISKQFNSEEWKVKEGEIKKQAEEISKKFNSPEWKKKIEELEKAGKEVKKEKTK